MYPQIFAPTDTEVFSKDSETISVPKCIVKFSRWTGTPLNETFGGKPVVNVDSGPMFAELAIMTHFSADGWEARWVETYGKKTPIFLSSWKDDKYKIQVPHPFDNNLVQTLLADIAKANSNSYSGCWDIVAIKDGNILFAESKRTKKDSIRSTQTNWLFAGLRCGLNPDNFLVVQWDF